MSKTLNDVPATKKATIQISFPREQMSTYKEICALTAKRMDNGTFARLAITHYLEQIRTGKVIF